MALQQATTKSFEPWKYNGQKLPEANPDLTPTGDKNAAFDIPLRKTPGAEYIGVTPALAKHWLAFNTTNRNIRRKRLESYVNLMLSGRYKTNGESIKFAYGKLIDGQHRLMAILQANIKVSLLVTWGLGADVQDTVDVGAPRSPADVLSIEGLDNWEAQTLGTAAHAMLNYDKGGLPCTTQRFDNGQIKAFFLEHSQEIEQTLKFMRSLIRKPAIIPYAQMTGLHYILAQTDRQKADLFFEALILGEHLNKTSPIYFLRQRLQGDLILKRRRTNYQTAALIVIAWNGFRRDSQWTASSNLTLHENKAFPTIQ